MKTPQNRPPSSWHRRLGFAVLVSLVALAGTEVALRIAGIQAPEPFFLTQNDPLGGTWVQTNPAAAKQWFPDPSWDPVLGQPRAQLFEAIKPPNTVRIFVVGESAAYGTPFPDSGSWPRLLEASLALSRQKGETAVQVINCAIRASTLSLAVDLVPEIRPWSPDVFVVYAGHNEFYGPRAPGWFERLRLFKALRSTKTTEFTGTKVLGLRADFAVDPQHRSRESVARRFGESLTAFIKAAAPTPVLVVMPHANEADLAPVQSAISTDLPAESKQAEALVAAVESTPAYAAHRAAEAAQLMEKLPDHAGLAHVLGLRAVLAGDAVEAKRRFQQSIALDMVPIRATPGVRSALVDAVKNASPAASLCDPEESMRAESPVGALGNTIFLDHVHLTLRGGYLLAAKLVDCLAARPEIGVRRGEKPDEATVLAALGVADVDRAITANSMANYFEHATVQASPSRNRSILHYQQAALALGQRLTQAEKVALPGPPEMVHARLARTLLNDPMRQAAELRAAVFANPASGPTRAELALLLYRYGSTSAKDEAKRALVVGVPPEQDAFLRRTFGWPAATSN